MALWRLINDIPMRADVNMATDEAMLMHCGSSDAPTPILRLYGWSSPAISVGYMQDSSPFSGSGIPVVRRITGGRAVLHDAEVTYSIITGSDHPLYSLGINNSYKLISGCIIDALRSSGINAEFARGEPVRGGAKAACFHAPSRHEVLVGGKKLVGSSQRRFKNAFLQHGSILFNVNERLNGAIFGQGTVDRMCWIRSMKELGADEFKVMLTSSLADGLDAEFRSEQLSDIEKVFRDSLIKTKYSRGEWNHGTKSLIREFAAVAGS